jgi:DNA-directed RNA polymerase subunit beta
MGSNMMAQAVPLVRPEIPIVSTGMEPYAALDSGQVIVSEADGDVTSVTGSFIVVKEKDGNTRTYNLRKYQRSNQSTCIDQRPAVIKGQVIKAGDIIADSSSTESGKLVLGQNVTVAFMSWEGANYEDAIVISQRLVKDDDLTSIQIEEYEIEVADTKLGPEETTNDIPGVSMIKLRNLDDDGVMHEAVDGGDRHGFVLEKGFPLAEGLVAGDDEGAPLVALGPGKIAARALQADAASEGFPAGRDTGFGRLGHRAVGGEKG